MSQFTVDGFDETMSFGQRLKFFRKKKGLSQVKLAEDICTNSAISQYEKGTVTPKMNVVLKLAEKLGIDYFLLMPEKDRESPEKVVYERISLHLEAKQYETAYELAKKFEDQVKAKMEKTWVVNMSNDQTVIIVMALALHWAFNEKQREKALEILEIGFGAIGIEKTPRAKLFQVEGHVHRTFDDWNAAYISYRRGLDEIINFSGRLFAELSYHLGIACNMVGRSSEAGLNLKNALAYYSGHADLLAQANVLYGLGIAHKSKTSMLQALELYQKMNDQTMLMIVKQQIAFHHTVTEDYHNAVVSLLSTGTDFKNCGNIEQSLFCYALALRISTDHGDKIIAEMAKLRVQEVIEHVNEQSQALAEFYLSLAKYELKFGDITEAKRFSVMSGELFSLNGMEEDAKVSYSIALECFGQLGQYREAFDMFMPILKAGGEKLVS